MIKLDNLTTETTSQGLPPYAVPVGSDTALDDEAIAERKVIISQFLSDIDITHFIDQTINKIAERVYQTSEPTRPLMFHQAQDLEELSRDTFKQTKQKLIDSGSIATLNIIQSSDASINSLI